MALVEGGEQTTVEPINSETMAELSETFTAKLNLASTTDLNKNSSTAVSKTSSIKHFRLESYSEGGHIDDDVTVIMNPSATLWAEDGNEPPSNKNNASIDFNMKSEDIPYLLAEKFSSSGSENGYGCSDNPLSSDKEQQKLISDTSSKSSSEDLDEKSMATNRKNQNSWESVGGDLKKDLLFGYSEFKSRDSDLGGFEETFAETAGLEEPEAVFVADLIDFKSSEEKVTDTFSQNQEDSDSDEYEDAEGSLTEVVLNYHLHFSSDNMTETSTQTEQPTTHSVTTWTQPAPYQADDPETNCLWLSVKNFVADPETGLLKENRNCAHYRQGDTVRKVTKIYVSENRLLMPPPISRVFTRVWESCSKGFTEQDKESTYENFIDQDKACAFENSTEQDKERNPEQFTKNDRYCSSENLTEQNNEVSREDTSEVNEKIDNSSSSEELESSMLIEDSNGSSETESQLQAVIPPSSDAKVNDLIDNASSSEELESPMSIDDSGESQGRESKLQVVIDPSPDTATEKATEETNEVKSPEKSETVAESSSSTSEKSIKSILKKTQAVHKRVSFKEDREEKRKETAMETMVESAELDSKRSKEPDLDTALRFMTEAYPPPESEDMLESLNYLLEPTSPTRGRRSSPIAAGIYEELQRIQKEEATKIREATTSPERAARIENQKGRITKFFKACKKKLGKIVTK